MAGFVTRNWRLKLLAVVLALVGWTGVVFATNPPGVRSVQVAVPQSPEMLPADYVLTQPIGSLTVDVSGTQQHLSAFSSSSLQVSANYDVIKAVGSHVPATVRVPVKVTDTDPNTLLNSPPTYVDALVDRSGSSTANVVVAVSRTPSAGYQIGSVQAAPATVTATGPEHALIGLQVKTQPIDLYNQEANFNKDTVAVYPYDARGTLLSDVNLNPATVNIQITVLPLNTIRTSSVVIGPVTGVPTGYTVTVNSYTPATVTLSGPQRQMSSPSLAAVTTASINTGGQTGTRTYHVSIPVPTGIAVSPSTVTVTITVAPIPPPPTTAPSPTPGSTASPASPTPTPTGGSPGG